MPRRYENIFRFRVTLTRLRPEIWRRIEVPENYSFWDLHVAIQDAMGWSDHRTHLFVLGTLEAGDEVRIGGACPEEIVDLRFADPGRAVPLAQYFREPGDSGFYEYDFSNYWVHKVVLEAIAPRSTSVRYPRCTKGARACPPEHCGGPFGFRNLLAVLGDPDHEDHASLLESLGGSFDPDEFDPTTVHFDDPHARWWWRVSPPWPRPKGIGFAEIAASLPGAEPPKRQGRRRT